jgi:hypothetical protein
MLPLPPHMMEAQASLAKSKLFVCLEEQRVLLGRRPDRGERD